MLSALADAVNCVWAPSSMRGFGSKGFYPCLILPYPLPLQRAILILALLLLPVSLFAQEPVTKWADATSWATAFVNPTIATVDALKSNQKACRLGRIALSEGIANGVALTMKHFIVSPRPCLGCAPDGMPSGHSGNAMIGSSGWRYGFVFGVSTGTLRVEANRHYTKQVVAGLALGGLAEWAGHLVKCP